MNIVRKIKDVILYIDSRMPFHIRYYVLFRRVKGRWPRLFFPQDYSDFIFKDNFWGNHNIHAYLADKLEVRKYVEECGLGNILIPLLGAWESASKVDFDSLPNQFAIKCNHSCGMNIICFDKSKLDIKKTREKLDKWMHEEHPIFFERHYFHIKPMIIAEALIPNNQDGCFPTDYKIHCAAGEPVFIQCCVGRNENSDGKRLVYDCNWNKLPFVKEGDFYTEDEILRPAKLDYMLEVAKRLSKNLDYCRVDLYETDNEVLFGEITLTPMGGWLIFFSNSALEYMGQKIIEGKKKA